MVGKISRAGRDLAGEVSRTIIAETKWTGDHYAKTFLERCSWNALLGPCVARANAIRSGARVQGSTSQRCRSNEEANPGNGGYGFQLRRIGISRIRDLEVSDRHS